MRGCDYHVGAPRIAQTEPFLFGLGRYVGEYNSTAHDGKPAGTDKEMEMKRKLGLRQCHIQEFW